MRAPLRPAGTPLQKRRTWLGPPSDPPSEVDVMEVEDQQRRQDGFDANPSGNARARALTKAMKSYLEKGEQIRMGTNELEYFLLNPGEKAISLM